MNSNNVLLFTICFHKFSNLIRRQELWKLYRYDENVSALILFVMLPSIGLGVMYSGYIHLGPSTKSFVGDQRNIMSRLSYLFRWLHSLEPWNPRATERNNIDPEQYWNSIFLHKFIEPLLFPSLSSEALKVKTRVKQKYLSWRLSQCDGKLWFSVQVGTVSGRENGKVRFEMSFLINTGTAIWMHSHFSVDSHLFIRSFIH